MDGNAEEVHLNSDPIRRRLIRSLTIFTSNQPRHISLINRFARAFDTVYAIQECNTIFPGQTKDFFEKSEILARYFDRVMGAEDQVFGPVDFLEPNVRSLALKFGDLASLEIIRLEAALRAEAFVVFGSSWIRPPLVDLLIERNAINIHMGVSPYYKGSSCNFWAMFDGHPELVGATIHRLSRGLDSGDIFYQVVPQPKAIDPFLLGMQAVKAAHVSLAERLADGALLDAPSHRQDSGTTIRYTRNRDFNDEVAAEYLDRGIGADWVQNHIRDAEKREFTWPYWY